MAANPVRFPNESDDYRAARSRLLDAEIALRAQIESVAAQRRALPMGGAPVEDYAFEEVAASGGTRSVRLSELFDDGKDTLLVYSYMYSPAMDTPCPACTSLIDSFDGAAPLLSQRVNFAVVGKSPAERLRAAGAGRGWRHVRLLSSHGNTYNADYHAESAAGDQVPIMNVFVRAADGVRHFYATELLFAEVDGHPRHMDLAWPLWGLLDMTPAGRENWFPEVNF